MLGELELYGIDLDSFLLILYISYITWCKWLLFLIPKDFIWGYDISMHVELLFTIQLRVFCQNLFYVETLFMELETFFLYIRKNHALTCLISLGHIDSNSLSCRTHPSYVSFF